MNSIKLKILERVHAEPGLTIGGTWADTISRGPRTEQEVRYLIKKGYLLDEKGLELSRKGLACIDSDSMRNRTKTGRQGFARRCFIRCRSGDRQLALEPDSTLPLARQERSGPVIPCLGSGLYDFEDFGRYRRVHAAERFPPVHFRKKEQQR